MDEELMATSEPVVFSSEVAAAAAVMTIDDAVAVTETEVLEITGTTELTEDEGDQTIIVPVMPEDLLTNEIYLNGINELVTTIDPDSVSEEVFYVDRGSFYSISDDLPDYACVYQCNGIDVVFPVDYANHVYISDGLLLNFGSNYTAGLLIDGYDVSNYLSSEITIPTYHSATWYQYLQSYGQPYRIVDRYVNNYGSISSSTRSSVNVEWSGGNPWEGFTFDRIALFIIMTFLAVNFLFRKGHK